MAIVLAGTFISLWARRFGASGLEIWLPMSIIVGYAISPVAGFLVAFSILLLSWILFPFELHFFAIMLVCLAVVLYLAVYYFPINETNFLWQWMTLVVIYNIISNAILFLTGMDWFRMLRFILLSLLTNWLIFANLGLKIINALK